MQAKVPQNVDIEDKVIGPLTLRQFMIILIATGIILLFHFTFQGPLRILFWLFALLIGTGAGIIAFSKYGDQNAEVFLSRAIITITTPRYRIWKKENPEVITEVPEVVSAKKAEEKVKTLEEVKDDLSKLAEYVDTGGNLAIEQKDRWISFGPLKSEDKETPDLLSKTEQKDQAVDGLIAKTKTPKKEPLISEVASVSPDKEFSYPKIETK